jgi:hypothetical protein
MAAIRDKDVSELFNVIPLNDVYLEKKQELRLREKKMRDEMEGKFVPIIYTDDKELKLATELTKQEQKQEYLRCALDPIYYIETYLTVFDQTKGEQGEIVPFKLFPFQKKLVRAYQQFKQNIANKYRQAGVSTTTCGYIAWYVSFNKNRTAAIVANKLDTARDELMADIVGFIESCPDWLQRKPTGRDAATHKIYDNGSELKAFSSKGLRGPTPTLIFWDETAWTERAEQFWTATRPAVNSTGGNTIFVSCVTKDSFVFTEKGIKQIKDFINTEKLGPHIIKNTNFVGVHNTRKSNIIFNNGYVDTFKIKTTYSELESSENHKFWAYKNDKYGWIKASELEIGDYVSIQKGVNVWGSNDDCSDFKPTESHHIKNVFKPTVITSELSYLIGLYISEGCGIKRRKKYQGITITCGDDISNTLINLNIPFYTKDKLHYEIGSLNVSEFFEYLGFDFSKKAPQKIIPSRLLEMSKENIVAMMQGIMDGDGWATYNSKKNKIRIGIGLSSLELIKQLRIILNNFGILTEFQQVITPKTEKVKVESTQYRLTANGSYAKKYFDEIGFRLKRKKFIINDYDISKLGHVGVSDNIPNGSEIIDDICQDIMYYGIHSYLNENNINVKDIVQKKKGIRPTSRKTILNLIKSEKENISNQILEKYDHIINENMVWTKITSIEKSKNRTYDFSMSNENPKEKDEFHMQLTYNQFVTHNTPNGLDSVFYKTFEDARRGESNFNSVELWWYNDPRYTHTKKGVFDLVWIKNKGKDTEDRVKDEHWSEEKRLEMIKNGYEASSSWFESMVLDYNGNDRQLAQELLCSFLGSGDNFISQEHIQRIEQEEMCNPIRKEYVDKNMWIWEDEIEDAEYIQIVDASAGHGEDNSSVNVFKILEETITKPVNRNGVIKMKKATRKIAEQVAEYYGKVSPQVLADISYQYGIKYNNAYTIIDVTGGWGANTSEKLMEMGYENVHYSDVSNKNMENRLLPYLKTIHKTLANGIVQKIDLVPGFFIGNNRPSVLIEMERAIRMKDVIIHSSRMVDEMKTFVTVEGSRMADHKRSFHDDSLLGMGVGMYVLNFDMEIYGFDNEKTKKILDAFMKLNNDQIVERPEKEKHNSTLDSKRPDFRVNRRNPYGANSWLFNGLNNNRR